MDSLNVPALQAEHGCPRLGQLSTPISTLQPGAQRRDTEETPGCHLCIESVSREEKTVTGIIIQIPDHALVQEALHVSIC